ncbi:MAG TPA: hypothetical protein VH113_04760 [Gemmatimonadales bacterium]|jgi:hypothetical protein|nr:hypothetical protein [Gemmatimonadales bacterium]
MNLVPWFPEIAVLGGALALMPGLLALRRAERRPVLSTFGEPALIALIAMVVLDGLISARTGASFALGACAALAVQWMAGFGIDAGILGLSAWGTSLLGLGLVFEWFGSAAGMDDGGWKLFAQLLAAFALGSATITATRKSDDSLAESADAGVFATSGALIIAAGTPFVANRVDGVALPMLIATAGGFGGVFSLLWRGSRQIGLIAGAVLVGVLIAVAAAGLDPVALGLHESSLPGTAPLLAGLLGALLGVAIRLVSKPRWTIVLIAASLMPFHYLGTYGVALGALSMMAAVALPSAPCRAATVLAGLAVVAASRSGGPLIAPSHWSGWFHAFLAAVVVGVVSALGRGPRFALLRVAILTWVVIAPFVSR